MPKRKNAKTEIIIIIIIIMRFVCFCFRQCRAQMAWAGQACPVPVLSSPCPSQILIRILILKILLLNDPEWNEYKDK